MSDQQVYPRAEEIGQLFLDEVDRRLSRRARRPLSADATPASRHNDSIGMVAWFILVALIVNTAILAHMAFRLQIAGPG
jgi:hypothetical protein